MSTAGNDVPLFPDHGPDDDHRTDESLDFHAVAVSVAPLAAASLVFAVHFGLPNQQGQHVDPLQAWYPVSVAIVIGVAIALALLTWMEQAVRPWCRHYAPLIAGTLVLVALWDCLTSKSDWMPLPYFPGPDRVLAAMIKDSDELLWSAGHSLVLLMSGYTFGVCAGLATGILIGWYPHVRYWGMPIMKFVGPIPATALIPLVMTLSRDSFLPATALIGFAVWFPVTMLTSSGIANVRISHLEVAKTLGAGEGYLIFRVALPSALPNIFVGMFMGLGAAFLTLIVAETVGVQAGLGYYIKNQQGSMTYANMYAALIFMAVVFSALMTLLFTIRDGMLRWQQGVIKW